MIGFNKALLLNPHDPNLSRIHGRLAFVYLCLKNFDQAIYWSTKAIKGGKSWLPRCFLVSAIGNSKGKAGAEKAIDELLQSKPDASIESIEAHFRSSYAHFEEIGVLLEGLQNAGLREKSHSTVVADIASQPVIAVLPFTNLSGDTEQEYFADGITEDIINALTRFRWLQVIGRASSFTFKGKANDPAAIAKELGARYVLTGSVRKSGNRIRVAAQLLDAGTRAQVWSSHFDGDLSDVFKVQDDLTEKVVAAIEPALKSEEIRRSLAKGTSNLAAYDYYLRALSKAHLFSEDALREVEMHLRKAIELDPTFADAYAWLCFVLSKLVVGGWVKDGKSRNEQGAPAIEAGSRALELDPENGVALAHTAFAIATYGSASDHAAELARKALVIQPNSPTTLSSCGWALVYIGEVDMALECLLKAHKLNPVDPEGYRTLNGIAFAYILKREFENAATWSRRGVALSPHHPVGLRMLAIILAYQGQIEEARAIGSKLKAEQHHYQFTDSLRHQWMRDLITEGMRLAGIPEV